MLKISELLSRPERHTKGNYARAAQNRFTMPTADNAVSWCIIGATFRCYQEDRNAIIERLYTALHYQYPDSRHSLIEWNDHPDTTHQMVLNLAKLADV